MGYLVADAITNSSDREIKVLERILDELQTITSLLRIILESGKI